MTTYTPSRFSVQQRIIRELRKNKYVYIMAIPVMAYYLIFAYGPMYGAQIAFRNFSVAKGITGSTWVGFKWFKSFFNGPYFWRLLRNTLIISLQQIIFGFPAPILLALLLNELRSERFKRMTQTIVYLPHFISIVVICSIIRIFVARYGVITDLLVPLGLPRTNLLGEPGYFRTLYIVSGIWQNIGWGSIIYLSALTGVDPEQYEAAVVDGANRFHKLWHITLPGIAPTIFTMFILRLGQIMSVGHEKIILLYNANTYEVADVISTYVYRIGLAESFQPSHTTAIGLFSSVINFGLITLANSVSRRVNNTSLW